MIFQKNYLKAHTKVKRAQKYYRQCQNTTKKQKKNEKRGKNI